MRTAWLLMQGASDAHLDRLVHSPDTSIRAKSVEAFGSIAWVMALTEELACLQGFTYCAPSYMQLIGAAAKVGSG